MTTPGGKMVVVDENTPLIGLVIPVTRVGNNLEYQTSSGGGGGGAVTVADGADVSQGAVSDAAYVSGNGTIISLLKGLFAKPAASAGPSSVDVNSNVTADVDAAVAAVAGLRLTGWAAKERSGSAGCVFNIVHGATGAGGTLIIPVTLNANESWSALLPDIDCANGLSIDFVSGNFDVTLFHKTVT